MITVTDGYETVSKEHVFEFTETVDSTPGTSTITDYTEDHDFVYSIPADTWTNPDPDESLTYTVTATGT